MNQDHLVAPSGEVPSAVHRGSAPQDMRDQTILHAEGTMGNCLQATLASILGWPLDAVPHFALLDGTHWWDCLLAWLDHQGYALDYAPIKPHLGEVLPLCWMSGKSPRGFSHAVVGDTVTGQVVHDPHPTRAGIVSTDYTIYLYRKQPAASSADTPPHPL